MALWTGSDQLCGDCASDAFSCLHGAVELGRYAGSKAAMDAGALSAGALTLEATLTKTMFLLAQPGDFRTTWGHDLAGEIDAV